MTVKQSSVPAEAVASKAVAVASVAAAAAAAVFLVMYDGVLLATTGDSFRSHPYYCFSSLPQC